MSDPIVVPSLGCLTAETIDEERARQIVKWGPRQFWHMDPEQVYLILAKEVGEIAKAILAGGDVAKEVLHTAAVAASWLRDLQGAE